MNVYYRFASLPTDGNIGKSWEVGQGDSQAAAVLAIGADTQSVMAEKENESHKVLWLPLACNGMHTGAHVTITCMSWDVHSYSSDFHPCHSMHRYSCDYHMHDTACTQLLMWLSHPCHRMYTGVHVTIACMTWYAHKCLCDYPMHFIVYTQVLMWLSHACHSIHTGAHIQTHNNNKFLKKNSGV